MSPQESRHLLFFFFLNNRYALSAVLIIYNELGFTATSDTKWTNTKDQKELN